MSREDSAYPQVQILLVSEQAAANLLPALDPNIQPREAVLLVSKKMRRQADALTAVLREAKVKVSRVPLEDEYDISCLEDALLDIAAAREEKDIALNVTGGTKLMALAAQYVAAEQEKWSVFYVNLDTDEIIWLKPRRERQKLTEQLRLSHYLRGYGYTNCKTKASCVPERTRGDDLSRTLIHQISSLEGALAQLNRLAQSAEDRKVLQAALDKPLLDSVSFQALLRHFEDAELLTVDKDHVLFASEAARSYVKGGWLEDYVFRTVASIANELHLRDKAINLTVSGPDEVCNELDVAFMARNRLFIIECKTARMDRPEAPKANDALFKLAEIRRRVGGLGTRAMLVSYRAVRDSERRLASALNVDLVCGVELMRLEEKVKSWVRR